jgi:short-subunit dehydrogenase
LINNAGFAWKNNEFNENVVEITFKTNYFGTKYLTE